MTASKILYSLPTQILFHHLKKNLALILLWVFFVSMVLGGVGRIYGIHYLFLDPEYLNKVSFASFFWVGLGLGNFTVAFHITSYILDGHRFPFIAILEKPFGKYSVNNSIIPLVVLIIYMVAIIIFQGRNELIESWQIIIYLSGLLAGYILMHLIMYVYFRFTNKDIFKFLAGAVDKKLRKSQLSRHRMMKKLKESRQQAQVDYYFDMKLRLRECHQLRDFYDKESILKVFDQNHFNSVVLELIIIALVICLGIFLEEPWAQIPAAASVLLLFSIVIMLIGAISYWFRGWGLPFVFLLFILANIIAQKGLIGKVHPARGLDYNTEKADYTIEHLNDITSQDNYRHDQEQMMHALEHWKARQQGEEKPKLVLISVSGGGQRAALWTVNVLQNIRNRMGSDLMKNAFLITGASGGMIGAAYYRELYLRSSILKTEDRISDVQMLDNISKDNLNSIIFSLVVNDTFFKLRTYEYDEKEYLKDRGYIFEENLNKNLGGLLDRKLLDYKEMEEEALVPVMIMSPVVANDGRKLYVSASPVSFMTRADQENLNENSLKIRGVDFSRLFHKQSADEISMLSALRMSASFPYITPTISLPSEPRIEVMDAGIADNFGINDALRFSFVFRKWIEKNTSGVLLVVIRDTQKIAPIEERSNPSIVDRLTNPISSVYNNLANIQDIRNDSQIENAHIWLNVPLDIVAFEYDTYNLLEGMTFSSDLQKRERKEIERASLSWHLTSREKKSIIENINTTVNQNALKRIEKVLNE